MHNKPHTEDAKRKMSLNRKGKPNIKNAKPHIIENGIVKYQCTSCLIWFEKSNFYSAKRNRVTGITSQCKKCHCKTTIKTKDLNKSRVRAKKRARKIRIENPEYLRFYERKRKRIKSNKTVARYILNRAVKSGKISKPNICEICLKNSKITAHHEDYRQPLKVKWLCYECHAILHRKQV